ncbi:polysaccharide lyase 6 family protein [Verrucomicrobiota bacterium]
MTKLGWDGMSHNAPWFLFPACLAMTFAATAEQYRIGSNRDLAEISESIKPGDTIILKDDTWHDEVLDIWAKGEPGKWITFRAETPGKVVLTGISGIHAAGAYVHITGLYFRNGAQRWRLVTLKGHHVRLSNTAVYGSKADQWVYLDHGSRQVEVDHCRFEHKTGKGQLLTIRKHAPKEDAPNRHHIHHNHFKDVRDGKANSWETMQLGQGYPDKLPCESIVEYNLFEHCDGEAEIISNKSDGNVYRYNVFDDCLGELVLRGGRGCRVIGNVFVGKFRKRQGGIRISGNHHLIANNYIRGMNTAMVLSHGTEPGNQPYYPPVHDVDIACNTIVDCDVGMRFGRTEPWLLESEVDIPARDCRIVGNIFCLNDSRSRVMASTREAIRTTWSRNLLWNGALGDAPASDFIVKDPLLKPHRTGILRPSRKSPARRAVRRGRLPVDRDIDRQRRPPTTDIGCDHRGGFFSRPGNILSAKDVGVSWPIPED